MHALIIEDDALVATQLQDLLRSCGFKTFDFAVSSAEAVDHALVRCPDFITADVNLQPGNGIDAVTAICSQSPVPVLFLTANDSEVRDRMPHHAVLQKPFSSVALLAAVQKLISADKATAQ